MENKPTALRAFPSRRRRGFMVLPPQAGIYTHRREAAIPQPSGPKGRRPLSEAMQPCCTTRGASRAPSFPHEKKAVKKGLTFLHSLFLFAKGGEVIFQFFRQAVVAGEARRQGDEA